MRLDTRTRTFDARLKDKVDLFVGKGGRVRAQEVVSLPTLTGATVTVSNLIPATVFLLGVFVEVLSEVSGTLATFDVGDGSDVDRWGAGIGLTELTRTTNDDFTATDSMGVFILSATDVVLDADGANAFSAGTIRIGVVFLTGSADIRRT